MCTIVLIRPGCTDFDDQQRIQGTLDLPLNARGEQQVLRTIHELREIPLQLIYTSPCEPARSTALAIGEELGLPVREIDGLRNLHQGLWEGLQVEEVRRKHPKVFKQWQDAPETICPPEGEMLADVVDRVRKALERPFRKNYNLAVVASEPLASVIRCVVRGCKPECLAPVGDGGEGRNWELLTVSANGAAPSAPPGSASGGGSDSIIDIVPIHVSSRSGVPHEFGREA